MTATTGLPLRIATAVPSPVGESREMPNGECPPAGGRSRDAASILGFHRHRKKQDLGDRPRGSMEDALQPSASAQPQVTARRQASAQAEIPSELDSSAVMRSGTESLSDVELLERIARRDRLAFRAFYDRHAPRAHGVLRYLCGSEELAEDLLQEVFLLVWRKAASFRAERGDVGGWLYTICRNRSTDSFRRADKSCQLDSDELFTLPAQPAPVEDEVRITLRRVLGALAPDQREAVHLAYFGGLTYAETAQQLNVPLGTLKSRVRAALAHLREILESK